ncbi:MAG: RNA polymerase subunit sigma [Synergistales bacterium]|nr:RNA polymerase subunit sigma [Synergistales bacterium]
MILSRGIVPSCVTGCIKQEGSYNDLNIKEDAKKCSRLLERSRSALALTGAGISTGAGIPDFRGPNGIYSGKNGLNMERIFDIDFFMKEPKIFYDFYRNFINTVDEAIPTYTHSFLAALESCKKLSGVITQNIDALHQRAGSTSVHEIHGSVWTSSCTLCGKKCDYQTAKDRILSSSVPTCDCGGIVKPDIVFFGEKVRHLEECACLSEEADLLFVLGSSLAVAPASYLPSLCRGTVVIVNKGEVNFSNTAASEIVHLSYDLDDFFTALNDELKLSIH